MTNRIRKLRLVQFSLLAVGILIIIFTFLQNKNENQLEIVSKDKKNQINESLKKNSDGNDIFYDITYNGIDLAGNRYVLKSKEAVSNKLQEELKVLDPVHFNKMDNMNPQRVVRALEVCLASKKPFSSFHNQKPQERPFNVIQIGLEAPRDTINERIERRTKLMLEAGWLEETKNLLPYRNENAMNTIGYKELLAHLDGEMSLEDAQERIVISTRQFAKRQMTWFKKDQTIKWFDFNNTHSVVEYVRSLLK